QRTNLAAIGRREMVDDDPVEALFGISFLVVSAQSLKDRRQFFRCDVFGINRVMRLEALLPASQSGFVDQQFNALCLENSLKAIQTFRRAGTYEIKMESLVFLQRFFQAVLKAGLIQVAQGKP